LKLLFPLIFKEHLINLLELDFYFSFDKLKTSVSNLKIKKTRARILVFFSVIIHVLPWLKVIQHEKVHGYKEGRFK